MKETERVRADLHIHSHYSRATSPEMNIESLSHYGKIKGLNVLGTGDFTHPLWLKELKEKLNDKNNGLFEFDGQNFMLTAEISLIYSQPSELDKRLGRRVHLVLLAPSFDVVVQINEMLGKIGRLDYDGRPIFGRSCIEITERLMEISKNIEIIPAHCLVGDEYIHVNHSIKKIKEICKGDIVYTHNNSWQKVSEIFTRNYSGKLYRIRPWYWTEGIRVTPEHPFYAIKSYKCLWTNGLCKKSCSELLNCKNQRFEEYKKEWVAASELKKGDFLVYPRFNKIRDRNNINGVSLTEKICRLIGYYLAEGYTIRDEGIGFSFGKNEDIYINEVATSIKEIFGKNNFKVDKRRGNDIIFYSKILNKFFSMFYNSHTKKAYTKSLPYFMLELPLNKQSEILKGWFRGDKGYTVSRTLMNQMKIICIRLGIIPNVIFDTVDKYEKRGKHLIGNRKIFARHTLYSFSHLSFFEDKFNLLNDDVFSKFKTKMTRRHGWMDNDYIYIPIRKIELEDFDGVVFNLEVENDNSYISEFACVHNCWTPWFSLFGSNSGFNSIKDCFQDQAKQIHALETGLSSDPAMNFRLSQLDPFTLVSFSDSHSPYPWRLGRECCVFNLRNVDYEGVVNAIHSKKLYTIEAPPEYGKYHEDGHRNCNVHFTPEESKKHNNICPVCHRPLTIGVLNRVNELADRPENYVPKDAQMFKSLMPLHEVVAAVLDVSMISKKVGIIADQFLNKWPELDVIEDTPYDELEKIDDKVAKAIIEIREGKIKIDAGYDGVYGKLILNDSGKKIKTLKDF